MRNIALQNLDKTTVFPVLLLVILLIILLFLIRYRHYKRRIIVSKENASEFKKGTTSSHQAIFVDLSPKSTDVVELAVEIWRINSRINKVLTGLSEIQRRGLESSIQKLLKYLDRFDMKIIDHTDEKYNEGMNVDVLSFEKDPKIRFPIIKETIEPTIICKGHVIKKGKIIVITN